MNLSGQTKLLLVVAAVLVLIMYFCPQDPIKNSGSLSYDVNPPHDRKDFPLPDKKGMNEIPVDMESRASRTEESVISQEDMNNEKIRRKFNSKNRAKDGVYKRQVT